LHRLTRLYRIETAWWEEGGPACRDYFVAKSKEAGLVWIYRERPVGESASRWFLQGLYA
jgi:protein ImuB